MTRRTVEHGGKLLIFNSTDDAPRPVGTRLLSVIRGLIVDEITGRPPRGRVLVESDHADLVGRASRDGQVGLVGVPQRAFPTLDTNAYQVEVTIHADGYLPHRETVDIPADASYLTSFSARPLNPDPMAPGVPLPIQLHRRATVLRGRVVRPQSGNTIPVNGGTVTIQEVWPQFPSPISPGTGETPADMVFVQPPLHVGWPAGVGPNFGRVRAVTFDPVINSYTTLEASIPGDDRIRLSSRVGLLPIPGAILSIDTDPHNRDLHELAVVVDIVDAGSTVDQPATAVLRHPLAFRHSAGASVDRRTVNTFGPDNFLRRDAIPQDTCLFLDGMNGITGAVFVGVDDNASADVEFHGVRHYQVTTTADGDYRLPPLSRLAQLSLQAVDGPDTSVTIVSPDYRLLDNVFNLEIQ